MITNTVISNTDIVAEELANTARNSLSNYCLFECEANCCRGGYLILSAEEVALMPNINISTLNMMPIRSSTDKKRYLFNLGIKNGCPNLLNSKCLIHKNPLRPKVCGDYPLFIGEDKTLIVASDCIGVDENKLFGYLSEFKTLGYKLIYSTSNKKKV